MQKKKVRIRHIPELEQFSENDFIKSMLTHATEEKVACVNWPEYPYSPDVTVYIAASDKPVDISVVAGDFSAPMSDHNLFYLIHF